ncbi:overexpressed in colon carcinoma 1 protein isoform 1-T1 [Chlamydotis macqueenii]
MMTKGALGGLLNNGQWPLPSAQPHHRRRHWHVWEISAGLEIKGSKLWWRVRWPAVRCGCHGFQSDESCTKRLEGNKHIKIQTAGVFY